MRWVKTGDTTTNYAEVLDFMGCPDDPTEGEPDVLIDQRGNEFSVGDWYVKELGRSYTDSELRESFDIQSAANAAGGS